MRTSGPSQPAELLLDILDILKKLDVPYAIVGALAVSYHGVPRSSVDADAAIWLEGTGKSAADVRAAMTDAGYKTQVRRGDNEDPIAAVIGIEDSYSNSVDLLAGVRGMDPEAHARSVSTSLLDSPVLIMGAEDLIAMKVFAGGPKDLEDVRGILQVSGGIVKLELLHRIAQRYGTRVLDTLNRLLDEPRVS